MFAITVTEPGGPESMAWEESPDPVLEDGEVLITVAAAGVNRADLLQRKGFYPPPMGESTILGLEVSGVIAAVGPGVFGMAPGDRVCALLTGGGYAEHVVVPVGQVMPVPHGMDLVTAAALPEVACTVWSNLIKVADMQRGDLVLIHGGAGGIGSHAIQVAKAFGATVAVTVGTPEKAAWCRELGADIAINYNTEDFVDAVNYATGGRGADIVLDNMGAKYLQRNIDVLAKGGRLVIIGLQGGVKGELNLAQMMAKRATIHCTTLRSRPVEQKAEICAEVVECVWPLIDSGKVRPIVDTVLPITQAADAHIRMESSVHTGKILLTI